nr:MAG TPA: hypothetical protein [Caudoviricetes sp.]DAH86031.1 MAG TPA: hypothetical protein [Caudoviricetes sp.]
MTCQPPNTPKSLSARRVSGKTSDQISLIRETAVLRPFSKSGTRIIRRNAHTAGR